jgi:hypothetical protein
MSAIAVIPMSELKSHTEVRCAVRFPLHLAVQLVSGDHMYAAVTENISANGILFQLDQPIAVNSQVEFALRMPATALGTPADVMMYCIGRIVRTYSADGMSHAAAVIDEYKFSQ